MRHSSNRIAVSTDSVDMLGRKDKRVRQRRRLQSAEDDLSLREMRRLMELADDPEVFMSYVSEASKFHHGDYVGKRAAEDRHLRMCRSKKAAAAVDARARRSHSLSSPPNSPCSNDPDSMAAQLSLLLEYREPESDRLKSQRSAATSLTEEAVQLIPLPQLPPSREPPPVGASEALDMFRRTDSMVAVELDPLEEEIINASFRRRLRRKCFAQRVAEALLCCLAPAEPTMY